MILETFRVWWAALGATEETATTVETYTAEEAAEEYCKNVFDLNPSLKSKFPANVSVLRPDGKIEKVLVGHKSDFFSIGSVVVQP